MIKEEHIYLCQLGFTRPTIVGHENYDGEIEKSPDCKSFNRRSC